MKEKIIIQMLTTVMSLLPEDKIKKVSDGLIDKLDIWVLRSGSIVDDAILTIMKAENPLKESVDVILDIAEDFVEGTKNPFDDIIVIPLCNIIRATFGIEDDD